MKITFLACKLVVWLVAMLGENQYDCSGKNNSCPTAAAAP